MIINLYCGNSIISVKKINKNLLVVAYLPSWLPKREEIRGENWDIARELTVQWNWNFFVWFSLVPVHLSTNFLALQSAIVIPQLPKWLPLCLDGVTLSSSSISNTKLPCDIDLCDTCNYISNFFFIYKQSW